MYADSDGEWQQPIAKRCKLAIAAHRQPIIVAVLPIAQLVSSFLSVPRELLTFAFTCRSAKQAVHATEINMCPTAKSILAKIKPKIITWQFIAANFSAQSMWKLVGAVLTDVRLKELPLPPLDWIMLRELWIHNCELSAAVWSGLNLTRLEHLTMDCYYGRHTDLAGLEGGRCSSLRTLSLSRQALLTDISEVGKMSNLRHLNLANCKNLLDISALSNCWLLENVGCRGCVELADVSALGKCANLAHLELSGCRVSEITGLGNCTNLTRLDLSGCRLLADISTLAGCSSLAHLDLSGCDQLTGISALTSCKSLVHLDVMLCRLLLDISAPCRMQESGTCGSEWLPSAAGHFRPRQLQQPSSSGAEWLPPSAGYFRPRSLLDASVWFIWI
jgi:uncharacterized protein YjbI with pentapeptide repeats